MGHVTSLRKQLFYCTTCRVHLYQVHFKILKGPAIYNELGKNISRGDELVGFRALTASASCELTCSCSATTSPERDAVGTKTLPLASSQPCRRSGTLPQKTHSALLRTLPPIPPSTLPFSLFLWVLSLPPFSPFPVAMAFVGSCGAFGTRPVSSRAPTARPARVVAAPAHRMAWTLDDAEPEDYVPLGIAVCYQRNQNNKLDEVMVVEPLATGTLENVTGTGQPTSYKRIMATTIANIPDNPSELPEAFTRGDKLSYGEDFAERMCAAARTFKRMPTSKSILKVGQMSTCDEGGKLTFCTDGIQRILNEQWEPNFDDNVKQDGSIDVYGRGEGADESADVQKLYNA